MLDPATADKGGQPIYADSLRDMLIWDDGSYMDSKFGTDGALYVQTYDGFFRAGAGVSIYRYDYTGGAPTPNAAPRAIPIGDYEVKFSRAASGGVSWEWDFGDGQTSTEPKPVHRYGEAKRYTVKLTVTYADGSKDSSETTVDVIAAKDTTAPTTTAAFDPQQPGNGGTYGEGRQGLAGGDRRGRRLRRRRDRVPRQRRHVADLRRADRELAPGRVQDRLPRHRSGGQRRGAQERDLHDRGARELPDEPQRRVRRSDVGREVAGAARRAELAHVRRRPPAHHGAQRRHDRRHGDRQERAAAGRAGRRLAGDDAAGRLDAHAGRATRRASSSGTPRTRTRSPRSPTSPRAAMPSGSGWRRARAMSDIHSGTTQFAPVEGDAYLRLSTNGDGKYIAEGSTDGETYTQISDPIDDLGDPKTIKVGLKVSNGAGLDVAQRGLRLLPHGLRGPDPAADDGDAGQGHARGRARLVQQLAEGHARVHDGAGDGVEKIEYKVDGGAAQTYEDEPITVDERRRAQDRVLRHRQERQRREGQDGRVPRRRHRADEHRDGHGRTRRPRRRTSRSTPRDGTGSGVVLTEYRVDGGPWTTYQSSDDEILDGSEATFDLWKHAGGGGFERLDRRLGRHHPDGRRPGDALVPGEGLRGLQGQAAVPRRPHGRRLLQRRRLRPLPRTRSRSRGPTSARRRRGRDDDAWVAIYCGHEIQLWDGGDSEPQKTGSVYNFKPVDERPASPRGDWEDYEIEVVGQQYTIRRNGEVVNEFENKPGQESSRGGDPSTTLRQFTQGYIGLQNHSDADKMQYRNVRVEDLVGGRLGRGEAVHRLRQGPAHDRGPLDRRGRQRRGQEAPLAFEIGAATPEGSTQTVVPLVPPAPVSPTHPADDPADRDGQVRHGGVADLARDVRQAGRRRADLLHGRDGRHGEADGHLGGGQAAQAGQDDAGLVGRQVLGPALDQGGVEAVLGAGQGARPQGRPEEREGSRSPCRCASSARRRRR